MKLIFTLSFFLVAISSMAQSVSLTIFNNGGQQFFLIMNGIRQNSIPETNVKVGGMTTGSYEVKLIFADGKTADVNKKIWIESPGDYLARVKQKGKKRKLQFFGMTDASQPTPAGGTSINYRPDDQSVYSDQPVSTNPPVIYNGNTNVVPPTGSVNTQTQGGQVTTNGQVIPPTGTATSSGQAGTLNSEMNNPAGTTITIQNGIDGNNNIPPSIETQPTTYGAPVTIPDPNIPSGFGIHINTDGTTPAGISSTSTTTTSTVNGQTTTQTTTIMQNGQAVTMSAGQPASGTPMNGVYTQPATVTNEAGVPICSEMLVNIDGFMNEINAETFENEKREKIEYGLANACLTTDQAYRIVNSLTFEADRMTVSKFLYLHLTDKNNGTRLVELLTFDNSKKELRQFMATH